MDDDPPIHDYADRMFRESLQQPDNLREFLREVLPDLADGFDVSQARLLSREYPMDDWRGREADLLFEIPWRSGDIERWALVCVLIEHQGRTDPRMPLRTLLYGVWYWERQFKAWAAIEGERPPLRLTPILPIVMYTAPRPWGSARTLAEMLDEPEAFHAFAPKWEPIFWELSERSADELLDSKGAFLQLLAIVRAEGEEPEEFERVYAESLRHLERVHGTNRVRWYDLLRVALSWSLWRRPDGERERLKTVAEGVQTSEERKREVRTMFKSGGQAIYEEGKTEGIREGKTEGIREGKTEGIKEGKAEGKAEAFKNMIFQIGQKRLGLPNREVALAIQTIVDADRLEALANRILDVKSWEELFKEPPAS